MTSAWHCQGHSVLFSWQCGCVHLSHPSVPCEETAVLSLSPPKLLSLPFNFTVRARQVLGCFRGDDISCASQLRHTPAACCPAANPQLQALGLHSLLSSLIRFPLSGNGSLAYSPTPRHPPALSPTARGAWNGPAVKTRSWMSELAQLGPNLGQNRLWRWVAPGLSTRTREQTDPSRTPLGPSSMAWASCSASSSMKQAQHSPPLGSFS